MSDERLDDEAPPEIPDLAKESGADLAASAAGKSATKRDSDLDIEIDVDVPPSDPGEEIEAVEVVSSPVPAPPPKMRERLPTHPATPSARASMPDISDVPEGTSALPRPVSQPPPPPRPVSQPPPPRPVSQPPPPRPVSQPPRPVSQPPRPISHPPPAAATAAPRLDSEPPTEPYNPAPEPHADVAEEEEPPPSAATSYPPPPMVPEHATQAETPPVSVKPMRVIRVSATRPDGAAAEKAPTTGPVSGERPVVTPARAEPAAPPPAAIPPAPAPEPIDDADVAPASSDGEESEISFPADEGEEAAAEIEAEAEEELTEDDIKSPVPAAAEITVDVEDDTGTDATPPRPIVSPVEPVAAKPGAPPPPRREVKPVTPPSALDIKEAKEAQRAKQRKAWWEELFGEDFGRANARLKPAQIVQEANFIEESLGVAKGGVVLDLACGSGHHAVELARRGYGVVGYDLSLYQLAVAADVAQDAGQKLNLLQGDMREMAFEEMFDGIYCWNTSFGYFEEEKNSAVAQRIFRALRPGGMFLVDVANRDFVVDHQPSQTWFEGDGSVCMDDMSVDFITSRLRVKRSLILDDGRTLECVYSIRLYSLHELGKVLHDVGFRVTEASGHPSTPGVFFGASSPRIIILAQRP